MTVSAYLDQYRLCILSIRNKLEQRKRLREQVTDLAPKFSVSRSTGYVTDIVGKTAERLYDLELEIDAAVEQLVKLYRDIERIISLVEEQKLRVILEMRYINGKTYEQIAVEMHYSCMQIQRLHKQSLQKAEQAMALENRAMVRNGEVQMG